jgi:hypothetical protein
VVPIVIATSVAARRLDVKRLKLGLTSMPRPYGGQTRYAGNKETSSLRDKRVTQLLFIALLEGKLASMHFQMSLAIGITGILSRYLICGTQKVAIYDCRRNGVMQFVT